MKDKGLLQNIFHPDRDIPQAAAALGKKGGKVKVAKGFSKMDPERRSAIAKAAAAKRWAKKEAK